MFTSTQNKTQDNAPSANDYGDSLSSMVDTSDESYEKLLAHAQEILGDREHTETRKKINLLTQELDKKIAKERSDRQKESMRETLQKADKITKANHNVSTSFKNSSKDFYKGKSVKDNIDENLNRSNDAYQVENFDTLLDDVKTPKQIEKSFDKIDNDDNDKYQYKLQDGYPIEQITTVGLLTGQEKRLKKCLILKTYGGGTWRTYCQPLKKPTQCSEYDWHELDTKAIMYC